MIVNEDGEPIAEHFRGIYSLSSQNILPSNQARYTDIGCDEAPCSASRTDKVYGYRCCSMHMKRAGDLRSKLSNAVCFT